MKSTFLSIAVAFLSASTSILASPVLIDMDESNMALAKRVVGTTCKPRPGVSCLARRDINEATFQEVGLFKRTGRHVHHIPGHHGHVGHHGKHSKKMTMASPAAVSGADVAAV
ncbi:uncharacterized protein FA14DRAFT_180774 [Meira miltonrushii]|uniref:Uncharacterized protein n=1 Tax=Meira miltonrushii TaxID=1280837 RepID=A0A316V987_9BASI|nr:uncharacterized protein FA14DRAFT_180774 [Meira miltonrushii]PWN34147.1 hypothetical protein FA14DRAFT_180774 [Meira miltonrushii]